MVTSTIVSSISNKTHTIVFEFNCPYCRKTRRAHIRTNDAGSKNMDTVVCRCGHTINILALKYLFRDTEFVEDLLQYFVQ